MVETTITFLALLALVALVGAVSALIVLGRSPLTAVSVLYPYANAMAGSVATVATLGSLFMSEIAGFTPCLLCWVQRGFMYPLMLVFLLRRHFRIQSLWLVAWALSGALVSAFHYAEEHIPALGESSFCSPEVPCSFIWFERFGFVTLPLMAFCAFVAVASLMLVEHRGQKSRGKLTEARLS
jgi:disulfide bond formation protein DsbB